MAIGNPFGLDTDRDRGDHQRHGKVDRQRSPTLIISRPMPPSIPAIPEAALQAKGE
jgi:hypothetical protein